MIGTVNGTLNGLHAKMNGLHGTIGTVNGTLNGLHGTVLWCSSMLQGLYISYGHVFNLKFL
jgi:hypothetical protein